MAAYPDAERGFRAHSREITAHLPALVLHDRDARVREVAQLVRAECLREPPFGAPAGRLDEIRVTLSVRSGGPTIPLTEREVNELLPVFRNLLPQFTANAAISGFGFGAAHVILRPVDQAQMDMDNARRAELPEAAPAPTPANQGEPRDNSRPAQ